MHGGSSQGLCARGASWQEGLLRSCSPRTLLAPDVGTPPGQFLLAVWAVKGGWKLKSSYSPRHQHQKKDLRNCYNCPLHSTSQSSSHLALPSSSFPPQTSAGSQVGGRGRGYVWSYARDCPALVKALKIVGVMPPCPPPTSPMGSGVLELGAHGPPEHWGAADPWLRTTDIYSSTVIISKWSITIFSDNQCTFWQYAVQACKFPTSTWLKMAQKRGKL